MKRSAVSFRPHEPSPAIAKRVTKGLAGCAVVAGAFLVGRVTNEREIPILSHGESQTADVVSKPKSMAPMGIPSFAPTPLAAREDESERAGIILDQLVTKLRLASLEQQGDPIQTWSVFEQYSLGWIDSVRALSPKAIPVLAELAANRVCAPSANSVEIFTFAKLAVFLPELATNQGIACSLQSHSSEDQVLWAILDAWRARKLPKTQLLASIEAAAQDTRTKRRFLSDAQEEELRAPKLSSNRR